MIAKTKERMCASDNSRIRNPIFKLNFSFLILLPSSKHLHHSLPYRSTTKSTTPVVGWDGKGREAFKKDRGQTRYIEGIKKKKKKIAAEERKHPDPLPKKD